VVEVVDIIPMEEMELEDLVEEEEVMGMVVALLVMILIPMKLLHLVVEDVAI
jgi:hypothetical protein